MTITHDIDKITLSDTSPLTLHFTTDEILSHLFAVIVSANSEILFAPTSLICVGGDRIETTISEHQVRQLLDHAVETGNPAFILFVTAISARSTHTSALPILLSVAEMQHSLNASVVSVA